MSKGRIVKEVPRLLWISDAVAHTGFASVCHGVLDFLYKKYDVSVLGINYFGDPHEYPYKIYPATLGGDVYGVNRTADLVRMLKPHIVCIVNDPWIVRTYMQALDTPVGQTEQGNIYAHKVAYMPIDGKNIQPDFISPLNNLDQAIFYTQFALDEARRSSLTTENVSIIPHGINVTEFYPIDRTKARAKLANVPENWFIVGCINRNQPRKRIDLALQYFAEFAKDKPENVKFYFHGALQDVGWNILQLADYYGIGDRMMITSPNMTTAVGVSRDLLCNIYNSFDVQVTTTGGEGWGLTQMEGMAARVAQICPDWSGLGDWAREGVHLVDCTTTQAHSGGLNTIAGIPDKVQFIDALNRMYYDEAYRTDVARRGYELVTQPKYRWSAVAQEFDNLFKKVMYR